MAQKAATIHWEIAERILWHVRAGNTNEEAVRMTVVEEYGEVSVTPEDITKIANALDELSAQYQPAGYWYGVLWEALTPNLRRGIAPVEAGLKMPGWGWALLIGGFVFALFWRRGGVS